MIKKIPNSAKINHKVGGFHIQILYPGTALSSADTGIGTIGRIDHANITPGTHIPMHPHQDDEILTYTRKGKTRHKDSEGIADVVSENRLMMMNAGSSFYHDELILEDGPTEVLQIFLRPEKSGLKPMVQFYDLPETYSINKWRAIAGKGSEYPLQIRSSTWLYDIRMEKGNQQTLPPLPIANASCLIYLFNGKVTVNDTIELSKGESIIEEQENIQLNAVEESDLVLFVTDKNAPYFEGGMFSGNKR